MVCSPKTSDRRTAEELRPRGLLHRADADVRDLGGRGQYQGVEDGRGDVARLEQKLRAIRFALGGMDPGLRGTRCPPEVHAQHPQSILVDLIAQAVGDGLQRVFARGVPADPGARDTPILELMNTTCPWASRS